MPVWDVNYRIGPGYEIKLGVFIYFVEFNQGIQGITFTGIFYFYVETLNLSFDKTAIFTIINL